MLGVPASINELIMLCRSGLSYGAVVGDSLKSEGSIVSSESFCIGICVLEFDAKHCYVMAIWS